MKSIPYICTQILVKLKNREEMKPRELAVLLANVGYIINLAKTVNMNKEAMDTHTSTVKAGQSRLDGYTKQYENKEYMETLSPAEKKCLSENAQNVYMTLQSLSKELDYLEMSKQNTFVVNALSQLEHVYLLLEYLIEDMGKTGETILPHLTSIKPKHFDKATYRVQIEGLYAEVEALAYDFYSDNVKAGASNLMTVGIADHLMVASMWLLREKERTQQEASPEVRKIELPAETTPEVPKGPADVIPAEGAPVK